jgi:hypothetical protein
MKTQWFTTAAALVGALITSNAGATVISGSITDWVESGPREQFGDGTNYVSAWWSIATSSTSYFYGSFFGHVSDVAHAAGVTDVTQISDASALTFTSGFIGTFGTGAFLVFRNTFSGYYGALRIDDISPRYPNLLDGTWWFQTDGTDDFSGRQTAVPEPGTLALLGLGLAGLGLSRRRKA